MKYELRKEHDLQLFAKYLLCHPTEIIAAARARKQNSMTEDTPYKTLVDELKCEGVIDKLINRLSLARLSSDKPWVDVERTISLAGEQVVVSSVKQMPWSNEYTDGEDVAALHRFEWMYRLLTECVADRKDIHDIGEVFQYIVLNWLDHYMQAGMKINTEGCHLEVWQTYSVAERVINWIYGLLVPSLKDFENKRIVEAIRSQLIYIAHNLEYYGEIFTCNHLSNDGRALFIGGMVLADRELTDLGFQILIQETDRILSEKIFLREGSAHYQFLITRNYAEVLLFAKLYENTRAVETLAPFVEQLLEGCYFFLYKNAEAVQDIPRIGDISPDCTPEWLMGVPYIAEIILYGMAKSELPKTIGWHTVICAILNAKKQSADVSKNVYEVEGDYCFADWLRVNKYDWILFSHVNHICHPYTLGHVHQDTGGIELIHKGRRIIIDTGRKNYLDAQSGGKGKEWYGHSTLCVDQLNPSITSHSFYTEKFLALIGGEPPEIIVENNTATLKNYGFGRSAGVGCHERKLNIRENEFAILDDVSGTGKHEIILLFHIPYVLEQKGDEYQFVVDDKKYRIELPCDKQNVCIFYGSESILSTASNVYGSEDDISTIVCHIAAQLPWHGETIIRYEV